MREKKVSLHSKQSFIASSLIDSRKQENIQYEQLCDIEKVTETIEERKTSDNATCLGENNCLHTFGSVILRRSIQILINLLQCLWIIAISQVHM